MEILRIENITRLLFVDKRIIGMRWPESECIQ